LKAPRTTESDPLGSARKEERPKLKNERILYSECPLCDSVEILPLVTMNCTSHAMWREPLEPSISWVHCGKCEHIFTEGYFTDEALDVLFSNTQDRQVVGTEIESQRGVSAKMVERVVDTLGLPNGNMLWLDVGFGNGSLLMTAYEFGFDVLGVDLRKKNVEDIRGFGIPAYHGTLEGAMENVEFKVKPTVISMADIVEHEPFPREVLRSTRKLIHDSGLLLISMPNASAPLWNYMNAINLNMYWREIEHYHNFTREKIYAELLKAGFKPLRYAVSERYRCGMEILAEPV
jgi:2-polyprenyl-3-methyl-5-hydroxy-6-metoxy-1,4-benzoquinol methylase